MCGVEFLAAEGCFSIYISQKIISRAKGRTDLFGFVILLFSPDRGIFLPRVHPGLFRGTKEGMATRNEWLVVLFAIFGLSVSEEPSLIIVGYVLLALGSAS